MRSIHVNEQWGGPRPCILRGPDFSCFCVRADACTPVQARAKPAFQARSDAFLFIFVRLWCSLLAFVHQKCVRCADDSAFTRAGCNTYVLKNALRVIVEQSKRVQRTTHLHMPTLTQKCMDRRRGVAGPFGEKQRGIQT